MVRQGFAEAKIQGVEFFQLGQGGRMGHYPVHFHQTRDTGYTDAFVKDSSVHDSMTRWYVLHGTSKVTLARNVGYLSIGHGYYIEDGTETDNSLRANLGVFARAAVDNVQNPRKVPGILAGTVPEEHRPGGLQVRQRRECQDPLPEQPQPAVRLRPSLGLLDHQRLERRRAQHGGRRRHPHDGRRHLAAQHAGAVS